MNSIELLNYINNNESLDKETLSKIKNLIEKYPYFQTAHLLLANNLYFTDKDKFEVILPYASALCADRRKLFYTINSKKYDSFLRIKKTVEDVDRTDEILDSYLTVFSKEDKGEKKDSEISNIEYSIVSTDYMSYINEEQDNKQNDDKDSTTELKHQDIIDSFLEKAETNEIGLQPLSSDSKKVSKPNLDTEKSSFLTETLAKIYIKQKKYEQALAIIQQISLNFPKKSAYFADQIRFLELLILNEKNKKE